MERLKLIAMDKEDLGIISTCCQDAVMKVGDIEYLASERKFVMTMNRFVWENKGRMKVPERRRSIVHFNGVSGVKVFDIDRNQPEEVLSLLAVTFEPSELPGGVMHLVFSGEAAIRLDMECIEVQLSDMDAAWEAKSRPVHKIDE